MTSTSPHEYKGNCKKHGEWKTDGPINCCPTCIYVNSLKENADYIKYLSEKSTYENVRKEFGKSLEYFNNAIKLIDRHIDEKEKPIKESVINNSPKQLEEYKLRVQCPNPECKNFIWVKLNKEVYRDEPK